MLLGWSLISRTHTDWLIHFLLPLTSGMSCVTERWAGELKSKWMDSPCGHKRDSSVTLSINPMTQQAIQHLLYTIYRFAKLRYQLISTCEITSASSMYTLVSHQDLMTTWHVNCPTESAWNCNGMSTQPQSIEQREEEIQGGEGVEGEVLTDT